MLKETLGVFRRDSIKERLDKILKLRRFLGIGLATCGTIFVVYYLVCSWPKVSFIISSSNKIKLFFSLFLCMLSFLVYPSIFNVIFSTYDKKLGYLRCANLIFVSQIAKYIPGKIWGVVYQIEAVKEMCKASSVLLVNIEYIAISTIFSVSTALFILSGIYVGWSFAIFLFILLLILSKIIIDKDMIVKIIYFISKTFPRDFFYIPKSKERKGFILVLLFLVVWIIYGTSWVFFGDGLLKLPWQKSLSLMAIYNISWIFGFYLLFSPSGIGIREGFFIILGKKFANIQTLLVIALAVRFGFTALELFLGVLSIWVMKFKSSQKNSLRC